MPYERILCIGLVALDIVNTCERYPQEDEDFKANSQRWQTGGNACNTCTVLTELGVDCELFGSMSYGLQADFIRKHLAERRIRYNNCVCHTNCGTPTSCVVLSLLTGSRTIVHSRNNLPELTVTEFEKLNLSDYRWIHFEGRRNEKAIVEMIEIIEKFNTTTAMKSCYEKVKVSVELERPRESLMLLLNKADVVFISKDFARFRGFSSSALTVKSLHPHLKSGAVAICAWGEEGADGVGPDGEVKHSDAYPPEKVIDTLGAGDTFNAGVIYSLCKGLSLQDTLNFACFLAGVKCGMQGYDGLGKAAACNKWDSLVKGLRVNHET
ncbi:ketohexokinase-like [Oculina patagonica]